MQRVAGNINDDRGPIKSCRLHSLQALGRGRNGRVLDVAVYFFCYVRKLAVRVHSLATKSSVRHRRERVETWLG